MISKLTVMVQDDRGRVNRAQLTVVGVFHTGLREIDDALFRIPLEQGQKLLGTDRVELIALGLRSTDDWGQVQQVIDKEFPALEATSFAELDKVYYQHSVDWLAAQFGVIRLIILAIVVLGIFNTVSVSVLERKQEIGNLRANGESVAEVTWLLVLEGAGLGILGAALGIVMALAIDLTILREGILMPPAPGITRQFHVLIEFQPVMAVFAFLLGTAATLLATALAAVRVVRMPIGEALRSV